MKPKETSLLSTATAIRDDTLPSVIHPNRLKKLEQKEARTKKRTRKHRALRNKKRSEKIAKKLKRSRTSDTAVLKRLIPVY